MRLPASANVGLVEQIAHGIVAQGPSWVVQVAPWNLHHAMETRSGTGETRIDGIKNKLR